MYQNKTTIFGRMICGLLSLCMTLTSTVSFAQSTTTQAANQLVPGQTNAELLSPFQPETTFTANDPMLKDNPWVAYLFAGDSAARFEELKNAPNSLDIKAAWEGQAEMVLRNAGNLIASPGASSMIVGTTFAQGDSGLMPIQDLLNLIKAHAPGLSQLMKDEKYDEAFQYAQEHSLTRLITQPVGVQAMGIQPMTLDQMTRFYQAGARQFDRMEMELPWGNREWSGMGQAAAASRARQNFNHEDSAGYPNFAYFSSEQRVRDCSSLCSIMRVVIPVVMSVMVGVMTAGVGSAIAQGVVNVAGNGAAIAGGSATVAGVSVSSGSIGGTLLTVSSNAVAGAVSGGVTAEMQGGSFSDGFRSGLVGGAVGSSVGMGANAIDLSGNVSNVIGNQVVADYVTATAIGTASGAILNGGDLDAAFTGAATSAALSQIQRAITTPRGPSAEQIALMERNQQNTAVAGNTANEMNQTRINESIASDSNQAFGGLDFNTAQQSNQIWNNINTDYNNQADNQLRNIASSQLADAQSVLDFNQDLDSRIAQNQAQMDARPPVPELTAESIVNSVAPGTSGGLDTSANVFSGIGPRLGLANRPLQAYTADSIRIGYHGTGPNNLGLNSILTPGELASLSEDGIGSRTFGDFLRQVNDDPSLLDNPMYRSAYDRVLAESDRVAFFDSPEHASTYARNGGTIYQIDVSNSNIITGPELPQSYAISEGTHFQSERFAQGSHRVVGEVRYDPNAPVNDRVTTVWQDPEVASSIDRAARTNTLVRGGGGALAAADAFYLADVYVDNAMEGTLADLNQIASDTSQNPWTRMGQLSTHGQIYGQQAIIDHFTNSEAGQEFTHTYDLAQESLNQAVFQPVINLYSGIFSGINSTIDWASEMIGGEGGRD